MPSALSYYDNVYKEGWEAAEAKKLPFDGKSVPSFTYGPAMAINSAYTRKDHQVGWTGRSCKYVMVASSDEDSLRHVRFKRSVITRS